MTIPRDIVRDNPGLGRWAILICYRGSIAHGTYIPSDHPLSIDDKDAMAFCVPPPRYYLSLRNWKNTMGEHGSRFGSRGTQEIKRDEWDIVVYEVQKAIYLLAQGNPNVLQTLWVEDRHYIKLTTAGKMILKNRDLFVGKHVYKPFIGYARAQLLKMERGAHRGYMGEKRKALVEQFGFDTKNAQHLIRLLRMGIEFLATGELYVQRQDAPELLTIKHGQWSLEQVKQEADRLFDKAETALIHSKLPEHPDWSKLNELCFQVVHQAWFEQGITPMDYTENLDGKI